MSNVSQYPKHPQIEEYSEMERAAARMKSYTGASVLVFFLYLLFFIPGLIVNFIYYSEAQRMQRIAGHPLPGQGCLSIMLWFNVIGVVLSIGIVALFFGCSIVSTFVG